MDRHNALEEINMGLFDSLFGGGQKAAQDAAQQRIAGYTSAWNQEQPYFNQATGAVTTGYGGAIDTLRPLYEQGQLGASAYADLTGANGPAGQERALKAFNTDPGYQFSLDQANQAIQRQIGSGGFQSSGNVLDALDKNTIGYAQKAYGDWAARLQSFLPYSLNASSLLSGAQTGQGNALAGLYGNQGNLAYNTQAGIGNAAAQGTERAAAAKAAEIGQAVKLAGTVAGVAAAPFTGGASLLGSGITGLTGVGTGGEYATGNNWAQALLGYAGAPAPVYGPGY
jgi:hypothetical protein